MAILTGHITDPQPLISWSTAELTALEAIRVGPRDVVYAFVSLVGEPSARDESLLDDGELHRFFEIGTVAGHAAAAHDQHISAVLLKQLAKIDILEIAYKGAQPAYVDLLAGRVDLFFDNTTTARPFIADGRVKPLVTSGPVRTAVISPFTFKSSSTVSSRRALRSSESLSIFDFVFGAGSASRSRPGSSYSSNRSP